MEIKESDIGFGGKMQTYIVLVEQEIETRKNESLSLRMELSTARRLIESLRDKLQHT